jgi:hypothetical protein
MNKYLLSMKQRNPLEELFVLRGARLMVYPTPKQGDFPKPRMRDSSSTAIVFAGNLN